MDADALAKPLPDVSGHPACWRRVLATRTKKACRIIGGGGQDGKGDSSCGEGAPAGCNNVRRVALVVPHTLSYPSGALTDGWDLPRSPYSPTKWPRPGLVELWWQLR